MVFALVQAARLWLHNNLDPVASVVVTRSIVRKGHYLPVGRTGRIVRRKAGAYLVDFGGVAVTARADEIAPVAAPAPPLRGATA